MTFFSFSPPFVLRFFSPPPVGYRGFAAVFFAFIIPALALGQESGASNERATRIGIVGEFGGGLSQGSIPVYAGTPACGVFESGSAEFTGAMGRLRMPEALGGQWGLSFELGWRAGTSRLETSPNDPTIIFDSATVAPVALDRTLRLQRKDQRALLRGNLEYRITSHFTLGIGTALSYRLNSAITQTDNVNGPGDHSFEDGVRNRTMSDGERLSGAGISLAIAPSADYTVPLGARVSGVVGIAGELDLLSMVERLGWRDLSVRANLGVMIHLGGGDTATPSPAVLPVQPPPVASQSPKTDTTTNSISTSATLSLPPSATPLGSGNVARAARTSQPLVAHLELKALDAAGETTPVASVSVDDLQLQRRLEIRSGGGVLLDEQLLQRQHWLGPGTAAKFAIDSLSEASAPELQAHVLNIIAFRMARLHPNSLLTLRGSGQRSAEIRDYLHEAWGIALGRIRAEPSRESEGGANRSRNRSESVVLLTDTPSLFDPVELSARRANVDPPRIQLTPAFESGAGIQEWKIRIAHEGESVGEYSSQSAADGTAQINWRIAAGGASGKMTTLLAELRVRDSSGAVTTAAAQLPLHVVRIERVTELTISVDGKVMQGRWSLPKSMFSNQSGERFEERVIGEVAAAATAGSRIEIAIPEGDPTAEAWGKRVAAKLHDNRAAAGMRCTITTKAATLPSGAVEIRVRKSQ